MDSQHNTAGASDLSPLAMAGVALHEMFKSYIEGGFTERQALILVAEVLTAAGRASGDGSAPS
jgi:hypothetical protein